ncbi:MAG: hypothetical protein LBV68_06610 [Spirochaetaceae bacterium]|jgi:hypothetical protein|nr:hypothetical protein [Spirochaetaceae bacterium]
MRILYIVTLNKRAREGCLAIAGFRYKIAGKIVKTKAVRAHWGDENSLHYVLDAAFEEDDCRKKSESGPKMNPS